MPYRFFIIPVHDDGAAAEELNGFLRSHKALSVERHWVDQGASSFWSLCVDYLEAGASAGSSGQRRGDPVRNRIDYREILKPDEFILFAKLRDLRKEIAQAEAVPVYTIFTNEQLAKMVQERIDSKAGLEKIAGVGDARIAKYGEKFLHFLQEHGKDHEASGKPV